jgi:Cu-Zn family superoxide dismutase
VAGCANLSPGPAAVAVLAPTTGSTASGTVRFTQAGDRVRVRGEIRGLRPGAEHGFHVHEKGDCSAPDATSAGPHFNPGGAQHGRPGSGAHHAGDLQNLRANAQGIVDEEVRFDGLTLSAGTNSIAGRALVVHRDPDDYASQPAGNSGPRIACGVITVR